MTFWKQLGFTKKEWEAIPEEDREKLTGQDWQTKPCRLCDKPVLVLANDANPLCMEHSEEE